MISCKQILLLTLITTVLANPSQHKLITTQKIVISVVSATLCIILVFLLYDRRRGWTGIKCIKDRFVQFCMRFGKSSKAIGEQLVQTEDNIPTTKPTTVLDSQRERQLIQADIQALNRQAQQNQVDIQGVFKEKTSRSLTKKQKKSKSKLKSKLQSMQEEQAEAAQQNSLNSECLQEQKTSQVQA